MKKLILCAVISAFCILTANAKEFSKGQLTVRRDIVKYLSDEGLKPTIDKDGDVKFVMDDITYYAIVNDIWNEPYLVALCRYFGYEDNYSKKVVTNASHVVGMTKGVKINIYSDSYSFRTEVFCNDATTFTNSFHILHRQLNEANDVLLGLHKDGLTDVDFSSCDSIYSKAVSLYYADEDRVALKLFLILDDWKYAPVYGRIATCYRYGYGTEINYDKMISYYNKSIETGDMNSAYVLGKYYYDNSEYEDAFRYMMRCASNDGSRKSDALYMVGMMQETGKGTSVDMNKAKSSYRSSLQFSKRKDCEARDALLRLHIQPEKVSDYQLKVNVKNMTPMQMYRRGEEYENGLNDRFVSLPKAFAYFQAAAKNGSAEAYLKMGCIYIDPYYPFNDKATSDKWYKKARKSYTKHENSNGNACYQIGLMYENGYGVAMDRQKANEYYQKGADLGDENASYRYALYLRDDHEFAEAFKLFKKAAEKDVADAMFELAHLYEVGYGTMQNRERAIYWYERCYRLWRLSSNPKESDASDALRRLGTHINRD